MPIKFDIKVPDWIRNPERHRMRAHRYAQIHIGRESRRKWWLRRWFDNEQLGKELGWQDRKPKYQKRKSRKHRMGKPIMPGTPYMVFTGAARLRAIDAPVITKGDAIGIRGGKLGPQFQAFNPIAPGRPHMRAEISAMKPEEVEWIAKLYARIMEKFMSADPQARRGIRKRL